MIRYYICPIIGTGNPGVFSNTDPPVELEPPDPYRPAVADVLGVSWSACIPSRHSTLDGRPKYRRCLVYVEAASSVHAAVAALPGVVEVSADVLDGTEPTPEVAVGKFRGASFAQLPSTRQGVLRLLAKQLATRADGTGDDGDNVPELGNLEDWWDTLVQRMEGRPEARLQHLFVRG